MHLLSERDPLQDYSSGVKRAEVRLLFTFIFPLPGVMPGTSTAGQVQSSKYLHVLAFPVSKCNERWRRFPDQRDNSEVPVWCCGKCRFGARMEFKF